MSPDRLAETEARVRDEYQQRLAARRADATAARRSASRISQARLAVFVVGVVLAGIVFGAKRLDPRWLLAPALGFAALVVAHDRVLRRRDARAHSVRYYEDAARAARRGLRGPRSERRTLPRSRASLRRRPRPLRRRPALRSALPRAHGGRRGHARRLAARAGRDATKCAVARKRSASSRPALDLRESLALVGESVASGLHAEALMRWGESAPPAPAAALRSHGGGARAALGDADRRDDRGRAAVDSVARRARDRRRRRGDAAQPRAPHDRARPKRPRATSHCSRACSRVLEAQRFTSPRLVALRAAIATDGRAGVAADRAARAARRSCSTRVATSSSRRSAPRSSSPRRSHSRSTPGARAAARALRAWVGATAELEALASLATYAYEHPDDVFPELADGSPRFERKRSAIRCCPRRAACATTCASGDAPRLLLVSGSNMSGKSTLLRTVGVNAVLAQAGAPVRARASRAVAARGRRVAPRPRLAAGGPLALLRRDPAPARRSWT